MLQRTLSRSDMTFRETMAGPFAMGATEPDEGADVGRGTDWHLVLNATVAIDDMRAFVTEPRPPARLTGELAIPGMGDRLPFRDGVFRLFPPSDGAGTLMVYEVGFEVEGTRYHLAGSKTAGERPRLTRLWPDTTTLDVRLHRGGEVVGAGVLRLTVGQLVRMVFSVRTPGSGSSVRTVGRFAWLFVRSLARAYLRRPS